MEAVNCYSSQFDGKTWGGEVYPGGDRPLYDQVRMHAARYGSLIRTAYGEPFHVVETMQVDDVVAPPRPQHLTMPDPPAVSIRDVELVVMDMAGTTVHDGGEVPAAFRPPSPPTASRSRREIEQCAALRGGASKREVSAAVARTGRMRRRRWVTKCTTDSARRWRSDTGRASARWRARRTCSTGCGGAACGSR